MIEDLQASVPIRSAIAIVAGILFLVAPYTVTYARLDEAYPPVDV